MKLDLNKNCHYLLACSGGPDSLTLLSLLLEGEYTFDVAIVNYHLREESNSEVQTLQDYCNKHHIILHIKDIAHPITKNIEGKCREIRYQFFKELTDKYGYDATLVAHHLDDLIETYLLQKRRNNLPLYYGLAKETAINGIKIIRPLLQYTKKEIIEYADNLKLPYSLDKTNDQGIYLRNKIRLELKDHPIDIKALQGEINAKNKELQQIKDKISSLDLTNINNLLSLSEKEFLYGINSLVASSISKKECLEIKKMLLSNKPNIEYKIKGKYLIKSYDTLQTKEINHSIIEYEYIVNKGDILDTPFFYLDYSCGTNNAFIKDDDYPLTIRNALPKDKIMIKGYLKEVRRLFIDWKMPKDLRTIWPIFINCHNIPIYMPRYQKSFKPCDNKNFYVKF